MLFIHFSFNFFYGRMIALQNFAVVCQTSTWISHRYTYIPLPFEAPSHLPPHPTPEADTEPLFEFPRAIHQIPVGCLFYIWSCQFQCYSFHTSHRLLPSPHVRKSVLYVSFSTAALEINSSEPFFCICVLESPHQNWLKCIPFYGRVIFHLVYVPQLPYPFIFQWTSRLLPCCSYCKWCCSEQWDTCVFFNFAILRVYA